MVVHATPATSGISDANVICISWLPEIGAPAQSRPKTRAGRGGGRGSPWTGSAARVGSQTGSTPGEESGSCFRWAADEGPAVECAENEWILLWTHSWRVHRGRSHDGGSSP